MQFLYWYSPLSALVLAATSSAATLIDVRDISNQNSVTIRCPQPGSQIPVGKKFDFVVEGISVNSDTLEVKLQTNCTDLTCKNPSSINVNGTPNQLYNGPFQPVGGSMTLHLEIPSGAQIGNGSLGVVRTIEEGGRGEADAASVEIEILKCQS